MFLKKDNSILIKMLRLRINVGADLVSDERLLKITEKTLVRKCIELKIAKMNFENEIKNAVTKFAGGGSVRNNKKRH